MSVSKNPVPMKNLPETVAQLPETGFFRRNIFDFGLLGKDKETQTVRKNSEGA